GGGQQQGQQQDVGNVEADRQDEQQADEGASAGGGESAAQGHRHRGGGEGQGAGVVLDGGGAGQHAERQQHPQSAGAREADVAQQRRVNAAGQDQIEGGAGEVGHHGKRHQEVTTQSHRRAAQVDQLQDRLVENVLGGAGMEQ